MTNAEVFYEIAFGPHPWWDKKKGTRPEAWILWRSTRVPGGLEKRSEPIAIFNFDSDARLFMEFIIAAGLEETLIRPPWQYVRDIKNLMKEKK